MSFKPLPPVRGMSGGGFRVSEDSASIADTVSTTKSEAEDVGRRIWADTQWTNLSVQARDLGLPKLPYFDQGTMLLSKEVNAKLWKTLLKLYRVLGPEKAPYASPKMFEGGEVKWYSYLGESKGQEGRPSPLPSVDLREQCANARALADIFDR